MAVSLTSDIYIEEFLNEFDMRQYICDKINKSQLYDILYIGKLNNITEEMAYNFVQKFYNHKDGSYIYMEYGQNKKPFYLYNNARQSLKTAINKDYCVIYKLK